MSVLEIPRIYFDGEVAWDPITTNNYPSAGQGSAPASYDEDSCEATLNAEAVGSAKVDCYRQTAINEVVSSGNWNPDGTHRSTFFNTRISGVDTGSGPSTGDAFVQAPVNFTGMLVDCEPYGAFSSQLFFNDMSFGIPGGCRIYGKRITRFTDRYINFSRNPSNNMIAGVASVTWQTVFPKDTGLLIDAYDSPALQAFEAAMQDRDVLGVMVRWNSYRTVYYDDPTLSNGSAATRAAGQALQAKLNDGGWQPNPARSLIVGTVGLWRRDDPIHEPGDRALLATGVTLPDHPSPANGGPAVATAHVRINDDRISIDLSNSMPDANRDPEKIDLGDLTLVATDPPPAVAIMEVATIPFSQYDQAAYLRTSGIVDIPIPSGMAATLRNRDLSLQSGNGQTLMNEEPLRAIPEQPNLYINEGDTANISVRVYNRGVVAGPGVLVTMQPFPFHFAVGQSTTTDAFGRTYFSQTGNHGAVQGFAFDVGSGPHPPVTNLNTQTQTYMYLRVYPSDTDIAEMEPSWANVHNLVLSNWQALAPCMDNWLRLGDEQQVRAYGPLLKKLTDPANFEDYLFMPVTRDMTPGMRTLLYNFLDGTGGLVATKVTVEPEAEAVVQPDFAKLSKAMRSR